MTSSIDIFAALQRDHADLYRLVDALAETADDGAAREELLQRLRQLLGYHSEAEELSLYAALMGTREGVERARAGIVEHKKLDGELRELAYDKVSNGSWQRRFRAFREALDAHMALEEEDVFPLADRLLDADTKSRVLHNYRSIRRPLDG